MSSRTLASLLEQHHINPAPYDSLVMDTQGSELLVLKGALPLLRTLKFIQAEVADFEAYKDCCQLSDIQSFLTQYGYGEYARKVKVQHPNGGRYFDIVFAKDQQIPD
jgi:hypothetical protein